MIVNTEDLVTMSDVAREHGVTPAAASNWHARYPSFPRSVWGHGKRRLWLRPDVDTWLEQHGKGRFRPTPPETVLMAHG